MHILTSKRPDDNNSNHISGGDGYYGSGVRFRRAVSVSPVRDWLYRHLWPWSRIESERNAAYVRGYWDGDMVTMAVESVQGYRCERCNHTWVPRTMKLPKTCPKCRSPYWNTPRVRLCDFDW